MWAAESSLGNPIVDAVLEAAPADIALATSGHHLKCIWSPNVLSKLIFKLGNVS